MSESGKELPEEILNAVRQISRVFLREREALHNSYVQTAIALACLGERFPTRGELATRIVRRALILKQLDGEIRRLEGDYDARQEYAEVKGFWTQERFEQLPVELRQNLCEILNTTEEHYVNSMRVFGSHDRRLGVQIRRRVMDQLCLNDNSHSYKKLFNEWEDGRSVDVLARREQLATLARQALQSYSTRLQVQDIEEFTAVLSLYEKDKYAMSAHSYISDVVSAAGTAFMLALTKYGSFDSSVGAKINSFDQALKCMKDAPDSVFRQRLETIQSQARAHIDAHLPNGEFIQPLAFDGPLMLIRAMKGGYEGSEFDREAAMRLIDDLGLDVTASAPFVAPRKVSSTTYDADGHFFFYPLMDRVLIVAMPDERSKREGYPGLQMYLIKGDLETAKREALDTWHPVREGEEENFITFRSVWQPLEEGYDLRAFWHLLGDEGLKRVAEHLELRKKFPTLSDS